MDNMEKIKIISDALEENFAMNLVVIDVDKISSLGKYFVIASANNTNQLNTMMNFLELKMKENNIKVLQKEGGRNSEWILIDLGDIIVHIFLKEAREIYNLEKHWQDGKVINL